MGTKTLRYKGSGKTQTSKKQSKSVPTLKKGTQNMPLLTKPYTDEYDDFNSSENIRHYSLSKPHSVKGLRLKIDTLPTNIKNLTESQIDDIRNVNDILLDDSQVLCANKIATDYVEDLLTKMENRDSYYIWYIKNISGPTLPKGFLIGHELSSKSFMIDLVCSNRGSGLKLIENVIKWTKNKYRNIFLEAINTTVEKNYSFKGFVTLCNIDDQIEADKFFKQACNVNPDNVNYEDEYIIMIYDHDSNSPYYLRNVDYGNSEKERAIELIHAKVQYAKLASSYIYECDNGQVKFSKAKKVVFDPDANVNTSLNTSVNTRPGDLGIDGLDVDIDTESVTSDSASSSTFASQKSPKYSKSIKSVKYPLM